MSPPAAPGSTGKSIRLNRLRRHGSGRIFVLPLDHSVSDGPIASVLGLQRLVEVAERALVDAVVLHKGRAASIPPERWRRLALILHLSASTRHADDPDAKVLVATVEEALRMDADSVSVHVNLGSATEARQLADLGAVAADCARWQMPLLAMVYPRGPRILNASDPELVAHAANLAADLGADLVKVPYTGSVATMRQVVDSCPIPVLVAGGSKLGGEEALEAFVRDATRAGVAGVAMGRNVFMAADPEAVARRVAALVHGERLVPAAMQELVR
jgi:2-amino-4,5-dihydroxy-6-oxo-7-(phosphooxy)heptanoate synthase